MRLVTEGGTLRYHGARLRRAGAPCRGFACSRHLANAAERDRGVEPLSPAWEASDVPPQELISPQDPQSSERACTTACTSEAHSERAIDLGALAAVLRGLSAGDRIKLAAMLAVDNADRTDNLESLPDGGR